MKKKVLLVVYLSLIGLLIYGILKNNAAGASSTIKSSGR